MNSVFAYSAHILNLEEYEKKEEFTEKGYTHYHQYQHDIISYSINPGITQDIKKMQEFVKQAEKSYTIHHPAIASTYKYIYRGENPCISYVCNGNLTLSKFLKDGKKLTELKKKMILLGVTHALKSNSNLIPLLDTDHIIFDIYGLPKITCIGINIEFLVTNNKDTLTNFAKKILDKTKDKNLIRIIETENNYSEIYEKLRKNSYFSDQEIQNYIRFLNEDDKKDEENKDKTFARKYYINNTYTPYVLCKDFQQKNNDTSNTHEIKPSKLPNKPFDATVFFNDKEDKVNKDNTEGLSSHLDKNTYNKEQTKKPTPEDYKKNLKDGFSYLLDSNKDEAKKSYKKAAEYDPYALCILGNLYRLGIVFKQNDQKAFRYYQKSAIKGCSKANYYFGIYAIRFSSEYSGFQSKKFTKKECLMVDNHDFTLENPGDGNSFIYYRYLHHFHQHYPLEFNYKYGNSDIDSNSIELKPNIIKNAFTKNEINLNKENLLISEWFLLYQLNSMFDSGLLFESINFHIYICEDQLIYASDDEKNYTGSNIAFLKIRDYDLISSKTYDKSILKRLFDKAEKIVPHFKAITKTKYDITSSKQKNKPILKRLLEEFEKKIENSLNTDKNILNIFNFFIRKYKSFVPLTSGKLLVSEDVEKSDIDALKKCAFSYFYGVNGFPINYQESFKYFEKLSSEPFNDSKSRMQCALMLAYNIGINQNYEKAIAFFEKALEKSQNYEAKLHFSLFLEYYKARNHKTEKEYIPLLYECADKLYPEAIYLKARLEQSKQPIGINKNYNQYQSIIRLYKDAYELGNIEAGIYLYNTENWIYDTVKTDIRDFLINTINFKIIYDHTLQLKKEDAQKIFDIFGDKSPGILKLQTDFLLDDFIQGANDDNEKIKTIIGNYRHASYHYPEALVKLIKIYREILKLKGKDQQIYRFAMKQFKQSNAKQIIFLKEYSKYCYDTGQNQLGFKLLCRYAKIEKNPNDIYAIWEKINQQENVKCKTKTKESLFFLKKAAKKNHKEALYQLGNYYINHKFGCREKGMRLLFLSAEQNYPEAQFCYGKELLNEDTKAGKKYILKAKKANCQNAQKFIQDHPKIFSKSTK